MRKILIAIAVIGSSILATGCSSTCQKTEPCNECACQSLDCNGPCAGNWIEIPGWECK